MGLTLAHLWRALGTGPWPWAEAAHPPLSQVVADSRQGGLASLFVALPGEHTDGHLFVADAFARGAQAALVQRPVAGCQALVDVRKSFTGQNAPDAESDASPLGLPVCFLVPDTLTALQDLASYWRRLHSECRVVGVTGSVGKTMTKELIAAVLRQRFSTLQSPGNYNNEIGVPLAILQLRTGLRWLVQEMAMYALGEIARLAEIASPQVGVVTNVGPTHLARLGSIENIGAAKAELVRALPREGLAVLNGDDPRVRAMAKETSAQSVVLYGLDPDNDLWADGVESYGLRGLRLCLHHRGQSVWARIPLLGRHSVHGALAAAAVGLSQELTWEEVIAGLRDTSAQLRLLVVPGLHGATILDDTYNASPASTLAALDLLLEMNGRRVAVLGGMLELGDYEPEGHRLVGRRTAEVAAVLVTVGSLGKTIADEAVASGMAPSAVYAATDNAEAVALLRDILTEGDFVLVKGSRGIQMEMIVASLSREG